MWNYSRLRLPQHCWRNPKKMLSSCDGAALGETTDSSLESFVAWAQFAQVKVSNSAQA
jgi:hypothetical protein